MSYGLSILCMHDFVKRLQEEGTTEEYDNDHGENGLPKYVTQKKQLGFGLAHLTQLRMQPWHMIKQL